MATNTNKYLSLAGLSTFWGKVKDYVNSIDVTINGAVSSENLLSITKGTTAATGTEAKKITFTVDDSKLTTKISALDTKDGELTTAITDEVTRAKAAEKVLTDNLAAEVTNRTNAVADLKKELLGDAATDYNTLGKLEDKVQELDAKIGQGGNVAEQIKTAIEALDVEDTAVTGSYVSAVSETNGKISVSRTVLPTYVVSSTDNDTSSSANKKFVTVTPTDLEDGGKSFAITTTDIASDADLQETKGRVTAVEGKVTALASATSFAGVVTWNPENVTIGAGSADAADVMGYPITGDGVAEGTVMQNGDIVIFNGTLNDKAFSKEYILDAANGKFVELGDTTAELQAIDANKKAIAAEVQARKDADTALETKLTDAINNAIKKDKISVTDRSDLVDLSVDDTGKVLTIVDTTKLTHAVAIAETSVQKVEGVTGTYADVVVTETVATGDDSTKSYKVAAEFHTADTVASGEDKLTTAEKVKAYVEAKLKVVAHDTTPVDTDITKVVTGVTNKADGTGFDVNFTNFTAITDAEIEGLFV